MSKTYNDWRLPTIKELLSLVDYDASNPACVLKDTISDFYWASTPYANYIGYAWGVNFRRGEQSNGGKMDKGYVRCVRDGENGLEWSRTSEETMGWYASIKYARNYKHEVIYKV